MNRRILGVGGGGVGEGDKGDSKLKNGENL